MDLSQVTLTQMRYAVAVANSLNFRLAAAECHVSQSGLSMQVSRLEELIDTDGLFDRTKPPIGMPAGEVALGQICWVLRETGRAWSGSGNGKHRTIGAPNPSIISALSTTGDAAASFSASAAYPRVELAIEELRTVELVARLRRGYAGRWYCRHSRWPSRASSNAACIEAERMFPFTLAARRLSIAKRERR